MKSLKRGLAVALLATFTLGLLDSCVYAPKQPWTPKYKSHKQSKRKK